jgi:23S rRNA pseudouridine1911/1915/1917 synthase
MHVVGPEQAGAKQARLGYRSLETLAGCSLLEVELETGRKHQIRLQLADRGHPIVGDRKYGSNRPFPSGIALHARRLVVDHPVRDQQVVLEGPLPEAWHSFGVVG